MRSRMALRILPHFESKMKHLHREHRTLNKLALKQVLKPATYIRLNSSGNPYVIMSIHVKKTLAERTGRKKDFWTTSPAARQPQLLPPVATPICLGLDP